MIQYTLKCDQGHEVDSWFQSAAAFDALAEGGHLSCGICGSPEVKKALMAPRVNLPAERQGHPPQAAGEAGKPEGGAPMMHAPGSEIESALAELRAKVEANADYVGEKFTEEARAMHLGDKPERAIYGEARLDQAKGLIEDGVPLMPLPFRPKKKLS